jgi:hypothetical protein
MRFPLWLVVTFLVSHSVSHSMCLVFHIFHLFVLLCSSPLPPPSPTPLPLPHFVDLVCQSCSLVLSVQPPPLGGTASSIALPGLLVSIDKQPPLVDDEHAHVVRFVGGWWL